MLLAPSTNLLLASIRERWALKNLNAVLPGGIYEAEAPERTRRPYAVIDPVAETPTLFSNCARYDHVIFQITVVTETFEEGGTKAAHVRDALTCAPLNLPGASLVQCRLGPVRYFRERQRHKTIVEFRALVRREVNDHPV